MSPIPAFKGLLTENEPTIVLEMFCIGWALQGSVLAYCKSADAVDYRTSADQNQGNRHCRMVMIELWNISLDLDENYP